MTNNCLAICVMALSWLFAASARPTQAETMPMPIENCRKLAAMAPSEQADYVPGVDVAGRSVVAADLAPAHAIDLPASIDIEIGLDLADRLGLRRQEETPSPEAGGTRAEQRALLPFSGKAALGTLTIAGRDVLWNGAKLSRDDVALLGAACRDALPRNANDPR